MSRHIDAEWLLNFFVEFPDDYTLTIGNLRAVINDAPSVTTEQSSMVGECKPIMTEEVREALMRLSMCARRECLICKYKGNPREECSDRATKNMNTIADAFRERKRGKWSITNTYRDRTGCVVDRVEHRKENDGCGYVWGREMGEQLHNYCPNCGAKMRLE